MQGQAPLSNTVGSVLDPIVSLRRTLTLPPHATTIVDLVMGVTESREAALAQVEKYQSPRMADRAFAPGLTHNPRPPCTTSMPARWRPSTTGGWPAR